MSMGLVGIKIGMTSLFSEDGKVLPVTVLKVLDNRVAQLKTDAKDGYTAVQVLFGEQAASRINNARAGHFAKAKVKPGRVLREFKVDPEVLTELELGQSLPVDAFKVGDRIDVQGITKGKGFAGVVKRHHFRTQDASHGNSLSHRAPGSIGQCQWPGKVFKGKKMAGHMGDVKRTVQHQEVLRVDAAQGLILVKGAVPGAKQGMVVVRPSVKAKNKGA